MDRRDSRQALITARDSRAATDRLLQVLRREGWGPFLLLAGRRSAHQARLRPWAVAELAAVHGVFAWLAGRRGRGWVAVSGALALTHLGLLEERRHLSPADVLTLVRGNLPVLARRGGRWIGVAAIGLDLADGRVARRFGAASAFGAYADSFADAAVWTWLALRHEPDPRWRAAALAAWSAPVVAVTVASLTRGRMVDVPRPVVLRPAAAMQLALALRLLASRRQRAGDGARSLCPWKGNAHYYDIEVDGRSMDAAWYHPRPSPLARRIRNRVDFWHGVTVQENPSPAPASDRKG